MNKDFKPMLAATLYECNLDELKFPLIIQPKLDGIRCVVVEGKALSRKLKPIPNNFVRHKLETLLRHYPALLDGEIVVGRDKFNEIQSLIMSEEGEPQFTYMIFDQLLNWDSAGYQARIAADFYISSPYVAYVQSAIVNNPQELLEWEQYILKDGNEGIILRALDAPYKNGRSTIKEQSLIKFKRFHDSEAIILRSEPLEVNTNCQTTDNLGYAEHSDHQAGKVKVAQLGSWSVQDCNPESPFYNKIFSIGSGFTELQRVRFWNLKHLCKGKIVKYKYLLHGAKDKPRGPIWLGFRED